MHYLSPHSLFWSIASSSDTDEMGCVYILNCAECGMQTVGRYTTSAPGWSGHSIAVGGGTVSAWEQGRQMIALLYNLVRVQGIH